MLSRDKKVGTLKPKSAEQALTSLMRLCARAERSSGDAMRLMARWQVPAEQRQNVLKRLIAEKFIDDRRYVEAFVREKVNLSAWGEYKIKATLRGKGISEDVINSVLSEVDSLHNVERLRERLARKLRSLKADTPYQLKTKLIRHGLSLGFPTDVVIECAESLINDLNLKKECETDDIFF